YSQKRENYSENIGFIFQQVDLYLQSNNIGSCWIGMAKPKEDMNDDNSQEYVISLAFGYSDGDIYRDINRINRKRLDEISDKTDERLDVVRVAPSAMNSQPWYFTHMDDGSYCIYRKRQNILKRRLLDRLNKVDIGIALAHLYLANRDSFEFMINDEHEVIDGYIYEGSFKI
ncbi:MAG: nitroreductase, partial [Methanosphaera sp.]|nr:nitroreductase [Methanosphaera sp.]